MRVQVDFVTWADSRHELSEIRRRVFIEEQSVPEDMEWDGLDGSAVHILGRNEQGLPIACARLLPGGRIGRMAVLPAWRNRGAGHQMLQAILEHLRAQGTPEATLSAQTHAIPFYERSGFAVCSDVYDDAGIPHRDMRLRLSA